MDDMELLHPAAVIGTNSWGSAAYETLLRGSSVDENTIRAAMRTAEEYGLNIYDLAQDYGFGKAQRMIGEFGNIEKQIGRLENKEFKEKPLVASN